MNKNKELKTKKENVSFEIDHNTIRSVKPDKTSIKRVKKNKQMIVLTPHGDESKYFTENDIYSILAHGMKSIDKYVFEIYCNDDKPEYKNIYMDDDNIYIFNGQDWKKKNISYIDKLFDNGIQFITSNTQRLSKIIKYKFVENDRFCDCYCGCDKVCKCVNVCECSDMESDDESYEYDHISDKEDAVNKASIFLDEIKYDKLQKLRKNIILRIKVILSNNKPNK
jgi:hypothetical protein